MIFSCEKKYMSEAVNTVIRAVSSKSPIPIIEGILISSDEDSLVLTSNNLEFGIITRIPANVSENGSIVIDSKMLSDIIRKLPNDEVFFDIKDNFAVNIKSQNSVYNIMGMNPSEFPELPIIKENYTIKTSAVLLRDMIKQTNYAVATDSKKPVLTGSLFEIEDGFLKIVSLDGFRLAVRKGALSCDVENNKFIIPGRTLSEISRIIDDSEQDIKISVTDKYVEFEYAETSVISRLIDGEFFDYKAIIPSDFKIKTEVNLTDIILCVERADPIVSVDVFKNPIRMTIDNDIITVDCVTSTGRVKDVIEITPSGGNLEIGFNQKYLHDALTSCGTERAVLEFNGALNPCIIRPAEGDAFIFMVLPVRLKAE